MQDLGGAAHPGLDLRLRRAPQFQTEAHVLRHRLVRIQRIVLKDHCNVAVFRGEIVDDALPDSDLSVPDRLQARDHTQERRFSAAGGPDQSHEFAVRDRDGDPMNHLDAAISLADVDNVDRSHSSPPWRAMRWGHRLFLCPYCIPFVASRRLAPLRPVRWAATTCANRRRRALGRRGQMDVGESVEFALRRESFGEKERTAARYGALRASIFRFDTGVEAIRLANARGHVVTLPFMGQMVWSAEFDGVELAMRSMFPVPRPAKIIVETYGCLAYHSGLLRNGVPGASDTHALHGEAPCADIDEIGIACGADARGPWMAVTGARDYAMGFGAHYRATPRV